VERRHSSPALAGAPTTGRASKVSVWG
jgi:hypothetical protein